MPHFGSVAGRTLAGRVFRGVNTAASLKQAGLHQGQAGAGCLPRHRCRGLIEARTGRRPRR